MAAGALAVWNDILVGFPFFTLPTTSALSSPGWYATQNEAVKLSGLITQIQTSGVGIVG